MNAGPATAKPFQMTAFDYLLYAGVIFGWSTSWFAVRLQFGTVPPEVSVFWRFVASALLMFLIAAAKGQSCRFSVKDHGLMALTGVLMFSSNFICMYYGSHYLPSGLLAVVFSLASIVNLLLGALFNGEPLRWRVVAGGAIGFTGIGAMFLPQIRDATTAAAPLLGLAICSGAVLSFCLGNQISARLQKSGIGVIPASAWGMVYGTVWAGVLCLAGGRSFAIETTATYLGSMAFLILSATILAFYTYLTLLGRIGSARAGYATVMFPVLALGISTVFEDYRWTWPAALGLCLALTGNLLVLRRDKA